MPLSDDLRARARKIKLILMDIDGTLTNGGVCLIATPGIEAIAEMKVFNSKDGAGIKLAGIMGIRTGFITGRRSPAVQQRARELSVDYVYLGQTTKMAAFEECIQKAGVTADETAYLGDDLPDLPVAARAGFAVAVADAAAELKAACHYTTQAKGGEGAARELIELILKAQNRWDEAVPRSIA